MGRNPKKSGKKKAKAKPAPPGGAGGGGGSDDEWEEGLTTITGEEDDDMMDDDEGADDPDRCACHVWCGWWTRHNGRSPFRRRPRPLAGTTHHHREWHRTHDPRGPRREASSPGFLFLSPSGCKPRWWFSASGAPCDDYAPLSVDTLPRNHVETSRMMPPDAR